MTEKKRYPVITIDGPSGSGKGTICWKLAQALNFQLLDSGALYRIIGLKAFQNNLLNDEINEDELEALTLSLDISFVANETSNSIDIVVNDKLISTDIRTEMVGGYASKVAVFPKVRQALLTLQQDMASRCGLIADGRDMGTVVFPDADAKVYLTASAEARANRRVSQLQSQNQKADYQQILSSILERDERDQNRSVAPSKPADDALVLDSSSMDINAVYEKIKQHCMSKGICF